MFTFTFSAVKFCGNLTRHCINCRFVVAESESLAPFENLSKLEYISDHENSVVSICFDDHL